MKKVIRYVEPLWTGNDGRMSLRSVASIGLLIDFIINVHNSASIVVNVLKLVYKDKTVDPALVAAIASNLTQIAMILGIEAALIAAMLALKAYQPFNGFNKSNGSSDIPAGQLPV